MCSTKINVYIPDQIKVIKLIYQDDYTLMECIKNIEKIYSKIEDDKEYTKYLKYIDLKYDKDFDFVYKKDFFELDDMDNDVNIINGNLFYSNKLFNEWLLELEGIKQYLYKNDNIKDEDKKRLNMEVFKVKKELLKIIEIFNKREKENPLGAIFGVDSSYEEDFFETFKDSLI